MSRTKKSQRAFCRVPGCDKPATEIVVMDKEAYCTEHNQCEHSWVESGCDKVNCPVEHEECENCSEIREKND